jgi:hypothetical protein
MTWADFYLICFVVGFAFSLISFLGGGTRHFHLPHLPHGIGHVPVPGHVGQMVGGHVGGVGVGHAPVVHAPVAEWRNGAGRTRPVDLAVQLRHADGISGLVRGHRLFA